MFRIVFFKDKRGYSPIEEYLTRLAKGKDKNSRIKLNKIQDYLKVLREYGTRAGTPYVKHIDGDIWELRPLQDRIFFALVVENTFVLLHCFVKKTQKTPAAEIEKAKKNLNEYIKTEGKSHE